MSQPNWDSVTAICKDLVDPPDAPPANVFAFTRKEFGDRFQLGRFAAERRIAVLVASGEFRQGRQRRKGQLVPVYWVTPTNAKRKEK